MRFRRLALLWAGLAITAGPAPSFANAAFPDEFSVNFPPNAPQTILLGANFGMLISTDDGKTWRYACEPYVTTGSTAPLSSFNVGYYDVTADGAILADAINLTRSGDMGCTWPASTGSSVTQPNAVSDVFADPIDPSIVLSIVQIESGPNALQAGIVVSNDGGKTFGDPVYHTSNALTAIEIARSAPFVAYASELSTSGLTATLLRSTDSGQTWTAIGSIPRSNVFAQPRIITIDPADSSKVYVRIIDQNDSVLYGDAANLTSGSTILNVAGSLTAFLRAADGSLYAGTNEGRLYVKHPTDSGFAEKTGPHFRCLAQRPGTSRIFACADFVSDGYSLAVSDDNGNSFQPLMKFTDLQGPLTCNPVPTACAAHWERIQQVLCFGDAAGKCGSDGGTTTPPQNSASGGHCQSVGAGALALVSLALWMRRRSARLARSPSDE